MTPEREPWRPAERPSTPEWGLIFLVAAAAVLVGAAVALWALRPAPPHKLAPVLSPGPIPAASPVTVTGSSAVVNQTYLGAFWPTGHITIDNQVGAWFTPVLVAQADAWMAAGVPVGIVVTFGGPPQCDSPPAGLVVICLHPTDTFSPSGSGLDCTGASLSGCVTSDATTRYTAVCSSAYSDGPVDCAATSETIWIKQVFPPSRLANIVRHEIGHVLGLGYNPNPASVMEIHGANSAILPSDVANVSALYPGGVTPGAPEQTPPPACESIALLCDIQSWTP